MDASVWAVLITLFADSVIFLAEFTLFVLYRRVRNKPINLTVEGRQIKEPVFSESDTPILQLMKLVWSIPYRDMNRHCGVEGQLYLALHMVMGFGLGIMAVFGCGVLLPVYASGSNKVEDDMNKLSIAHILQNDDMMGSVVFFLFFFSTGIIGIIVAYCKYVHLALNTPTELNLTIDRFTVEIQNLSRKLDPNTAVEMLYDMLKQQFGEEVLSVYVVPNFALAYQLNEKKKLCESKLRHYRTFEETKGYRKQFKKYKLFGEKFDAIEYLENKVAEYQIKCQEATHEGRTKSSGFAFVVCRSNDSAVNVLRNLKRNNDQLKSSKWKLSISPPPGEIKWENLEKHKKTFFLFKLGLYCAFFLFFFLFLTPTALLQALIVILEVIEAKPIYEGFFGQILPSLILLLYLSLIVRQTVLAMVKKEKLSNKSKDTVSALFKFLVIMITYTFMVPLLNLQVLTALEMIFSGDFKGWEKAIANNAAISGQFFTIYIIHLTFLKNGSDFLQIPKIFRVKLRQWKSVCEEEKLMAYEAYEFRWAYEYGVSISAFFIILSFSVAYPLILVAGTVFCVARYFTAKYNLLCFYFPLKHTTGTRIPNYIIKVLLSALLFFSLFTCLMLFLNDNFVYLVLAGVLISVFVVFVGVLIWKKPRIERALEKEFSKKEYSEDGIVFPEDIVKYYHPFQDSNDSPSSGINQ